jgi:hypothetical protein
MAFHSENFAKWQGTQQNYLTRQLAWLSIQGILPNGREHSICCCSDLMPVGAACFSSM